MSALLLILLSLLASVACVVLSWRHRSRVQSATGGDVQVLARALRALPAELRLPELLRRAPADSWEQRLALALMQAAEPRARAAAANDLLAEVELRLDLGAGWPTAATRLSGFVGLLLAAFSTLAHLGVLVTLTVLAAGALSAGASAAAGRAARVAAERQRAAIDALIDAALGQTDVPRRAPRDVGRRTRRARR